MADDIAVLDLADAVLRAHLSGALDEAGVTALAYPGEGRVPVARFEDYRTGTDSARNSMPRVALWDRARYDGGSNPFGDLRLRSLLSVRPTLDPDELASTLKQLRDGTYIQLQDVFDATARMATLKVHRSIDKPMVLEMLQGFAERSGAGARMTRDLLGACDELFTNAMYHAPVRKGRRIHAALPRSRPVTSERPLVVRFGADARNIAISVRDQYGSLWPEEVLETLHESFRYRVVDFGRRGAVAGLGFYMLLQSSDRLIVNLKPGAFSEIVVVRRLGVRRRAFLQSAPSFNISLGKEERRHLRREARRHWVEWPVHYGDEKLPLGFMTDVSSHGAFVVFEDGQVPNVAAGEIIAIDVRTSDAAPAESLNAEVRWVGFSPHHHSTGVGLKFLSPATALVDAAGRRAPDESEAGPVPALRREITFLETELSFRSFHQALGTLSLDAFRERVHEALLRSERTRNHAAVVFVHLDVPASRVDLAWHRRVVAALRSVVRGEDAIGAVDDHVWGLVIEHLSAPTHALACVDRIERRLMRIGRDDDMPMDIKVGIAVYPGDGREAGVLLEHARTALQSAETSDLPYAFYDQGLTQDAAARMQQVRRLHEALKQKEYCLHFQPIVHLSDASIVGLEALLRWAPTPGKLVPPNEFLPLLEETRLIRSVGAWVLSDACRAAAKWRAAGLFQGKIHVNVSPQQVSSELPEMAAAALEVSGLPAEMLVLEITEGALLAELDGAALVLGELAEMGILLSLDDFGTGYSALAYLKRLPVQELKIDRSFVSGVPTNPVDTELTRAVLGMAEALELDVVAEGIETEEQRAFLQAHGCVEGQGYLFSRPLDEAALTELLQKK